MGPWPCPAIPGELREMVREEGEEGQLLHTPNSNPGTRSAFIYQGRVSHHHNNSMVRKEEESDSRGKTPVDPILCTENAAGNPSHPTKNKTKQNRTLEAQFDCRVETSLTLQKLVVFLSTNNNLSE